MLYTLNGEQVAELKEFKRTPEEWRIILLAAHADRFTPELQADLYNAFVTYAGYKDGYKKIKKLGHEDWELTYPDGVTIRDWNPVPMFPVNSATCLRALSWEQIPANVQTALENAEKEIKAGPLGYHLDKGEF